MDLYQTIIVAIAITNLAVTVWLLRLLIPIWRTLKKVMSAVDEFDFDEISKKFLNNEKPLAETIHIKTTENKEEGFREIIVTRTYKKPLDAREAQENFVRQMAKELQ